MPLTVVKVGELTDMSSSEVKTGQRSHKRVFLVTCTQNVASPYALYGATDGVDAVPSLGDAHPDDADAFVSSASLKANMMQRNADGKWVFQVELTYETVVGSGSLDPNPLTRPAEISVGGETITADTFLDRNGKPIVNSAGDPFETFLQKEDGDLTIEITRNESSFDVVRAAQYKHAINDSSITIIGVSFSARQLKMGIINAQKIKENGTTYWKVRYPLKARFDGFRVKVADMGYNQLIAGTPKKRDQILANGLPVDRPWPLDGAGAKKPNPDDAPATLTFEVSEELDFTVFGLP